MPQHHTIIAGVIGAGVTLVAAHQMLDQRRAQAEAEEREAEFQRRTAAHEEQNERARAEGEERERIEEDIFIRGMMHLAEAMHAGLVQEVARLARRLEQSARSALALPLIKLDGGGDSAAEVVIGFCLALGSDLDPLKALVSHPPPGTAMGSLGAASLGALIALLREKSASPSPGGEKWIGDVSLEVAMLLVYSFDARRHSDGRGEPAARVIDWVVPSDQDLTASPQERRRAAVLAARKLGLFAAPRNAFRFEESSRGMGWYTCPWTSNLQDKARQAADEWAEGTEWRKSELLVTNFDLAVVGNGRLARSGFRIGYSEQERGKYTINLQDVKGRGAQPLSVRQVDVSLCAYVLASKQLATTCSVLADRLQEALDEAQRGGGEGTVSLEHCCALSGSLEVAKHGLLRKLRDFDEDLLATHEQQVREQIRAGLLRSLEGACTWEGGEPVPAAVLRTEVDSFADSYCSLLSLRLQLTPRLDNGRTPSQSVAPQAVNMTVFDRLPWMNSMPPERLAMRRILEEDEKRRDDAAHTLGSLPAWYRRAYAGALLALYGLFVYWMYLCLALVVPVVRLLGPWGSISMDVATVDAGPDPVVANLNVGWTLVMLLAAAAFGLYTMNTLFVALVQYRLVKATDTVRHSASAPWLMFGLRYVGVQRESFDAANSLRFDVFGRLASWRRWPQPLYRDLSDLEADCAGQFGVWVGRLASTRFNEAAAVNRTRRRRGQRRFTPLAVSRRSGAGPSDATRRCCSLRTSSQQPGRRGARRRSARRAAAAGGSAGRGRRGRSGAGGRCGALRCTCSGGEGGAGGGRMRGHVYDTSTACPRRVP